MEALREHFRPEFLNRIDDIIIFDRLSDENLTQIVDIQLVNLVERLAQQKLTLELSDGAKRHLGPRGVRSGLWSASAEAGHSARSAELAEHEIAGR